MSELKIYHHELRHNEYEEFYLKYEADKVIADLEESHKKEVEQLLMEIMKLKHSLELASNECCSISERGVSKGVIQMSELKAMKFFEAVPTSKEGFYQPGAFVDGYLKSEADKVIADKDAEIARLKDRSLDVKDAAHVLKAFKFYLCQLTHCAYDERTAQWIIDNWEQDYKRVEEYK